MKRVLFLLSLSIWIVSCGKKDKIVKPEVRTLTEAVYASGNIYPEDEYLVFANADGILNKVYVQAGDEVTKGQPMFKIDSDIQDARYKTAEAIYNTAIENYSGNSPALTEAKTQLESARVRMENDSVNYFRYRTLLTNNATSKVEYDRADLAYQVSRNDYLARKNNLEKLKRQLYVELQNAENIYKASAKEEQNYFVKSLLKGTIYEIYKEQGEAVRRNDPIALLGDNSEVYLRLSVDELDIERIKIGQDVLVTVDVFRDKVFKAKVSRIHRKMNIQDQSFRVDAEFVGEKPSSYYGLTVEANIVIGKKENVLTIPKNILSGQDSVWVKTEDGAERIRIKKGVEDFDYVEVLQGINKNSELLNK